MPGGGVRADYLLHCGRLFVLGASSGIGLEISMHLWEQGWNLVLVCRNTSGLERTLLAREQALRRRGTMDGPTGSIVSLEGPTESRARGMGRIDIVPADLAKDQHVSALITTLEEQV